MIRGDCAPKGRARTRIRTIGAGSLAAALLAGGALATGAAGATVPNLGLGTPHSGKLPTFVALYDGHKDTYVSTDVSSKSQAKALKINYAASLTGAKGASPMYLVQGPATPGQVAVFGSEPGETDYSPLWQEITVRWKPGQKPVLLMQDDQIKSLAKKGELTMTTTPIVLNGPVLTVGKKT
jgi:hypothetical protein